MKEQLPLELCLFFSQLPNFLFVFWLTCSWSLNGFEKNGKNYVQHRELELDTNIREEASSAPFPVHVGFNCLVWFRSFVSEKAGRNCQRFRIKSYQAFISL